MRTLNAIYRNGNPVLAFGLEDDGVDATAATAQMVQMMEQLLDVVWEDMDLMFPPREGRSLKTGATYIIGVRPQLLGTLRTAQP
jgi:hypothetical protein